MALPDRCVNMALAGVFLMDLPLENRIDADRPTGV